MRWTPLGDRALRLDLPGAGPGVLEALRSQPGVTDVVIGEGSLAVYLEPFATPPDIDVALRASDERVPVREQAIHVHYDGQDLARVASLSRIPPGEVIERHTARVYTVRAVGFLPGFAYLGDVDPQIATPRLPAPRQRVPACSVGIAGERTGVYPFASPGGWNLLGTAVDFTPFDATRGAALAPGDQVRFVSTPDAGTARRPDAPRSATTAGLRLRVVRVAGPVLVQDAGRPGRMHEGVPPGGALVPELLARSSAAVGNARSAAALEAYGPLVVEAVGGSLSLSWGGAALRLQEGEQVEIPGPEPLRVRYVAVGGGIDVPEVLGGRGTLLSAGLGGLGGRLLRAGDELPVGLATGATWSPPGLRSAAAAVRVLPGPDLDRLGAAALEALLSRPFRIARAGDRTGIRLEGSLPRGGDDAAISAPMVQGAIQLPASGEPVILGPDHPTLGGYPVVAVVVREDLGALLGRRPGAEVRFALQ